MTYDADAVPGSYQSLAECWGWHRQTVKKFLQELTTLGAVTIDASRNRTAIHVRNVTITDSAPAASPNPSQVYPRPPKGDSPP